MYQMVTTTNAQWFYNLVKFLRASTDAVEIYKPGGASRRRWGSHDCSHSQDIGIKCFGKYVVSGNWGQWTAWSMCSFSCGNGNQSRRRRCNSPIPSAGGSDCNGTNIQTQTCNVLSCPELKPSVSSVHGQWGTWQEWESCNTTCGNGLKQRSRNCDSPPPMFNGPECIGLNFDIQICKKDICPGIQGEINNETSKPFSVGLLVGVAGGSIVVTAIIIFIGLFVFRRFKPGQFDKFIKNKCIGDSRVTSQPNDYERSGRSSGTHSGVYDNIEIGGHTNTQLNCRIDGQWRTWQEWETCNTTCGNGFQQRIRKCDSTSPYFRGSECMGLDYDIQTCYLDICSEKRKRNGSNTEILDELRVTSHQNDYDGVGRASGIQRGVYDTCNTESNVYANTQIPADSIDTAAHANILCNADNVKEVYENLKIA
ncbi:unnamed protein product [Mytilus coruscus]|uniref:HMCN n=1 Tax=Mytilus coruscus TaxID=42192 RepID=A0A6J8CPG6_MYTCO|nr:unnamed protein product [Mytilus coruscus]